MDSRRHGRSEFRQRSRSRSPRGGSPSYSSRPQELSPAKSNRKNRSRKKSSPQQWNQSQEISISQIDRQDYRSQDAPPYRIVSRPNPASSSSHFVCVRGLPSDTDLNFLQSAILKNVGNYVFVQILESTSGSSSSKTALVEFDSDDLVSKCVRKMDRTRFGNRQIEVNEVLDVEAFVRKHDVGSAASASNPRRSQTRWNKSEQVTSTPELHETVSADRFSRATTFSGSFPYEQLANIADQHSSNQIRSYNAMSSTRQIEEQSDQSMQPQWLFSGDVDSSKGDDRNLQSAEDSSRLQGLALQAKLWLSLWKTRLGRKDSAENTGTTTSVSQSMNPITAAMNEYGESEKNPSNEGHQSSKFGGDESVAQAVALDIMTGAFHIRRALEAMRKSDVAHDAFRTSTLYLRQFNDELSDWRDMYFSRDRGNRGGGGSQQTASRTDEKEKNKNLVEVKGEWSLDDPPTSSVSIPQFAKCPTPAPPSFANVATTLPSPLSNSNWFMIGQAQPRFSATAAIRRGELPPLVEVPRYKAKIVLIQFGHIASVSVLSRAIRAISMGGYVDLDWFSKSDTSSASAAQPSTGTIRLGDSGLSFANWYRCFEFVIKIGETIGAPNDYLTSLSAYKRVIELWWRQVAAADFQAAVLLWLPFYELFDKNWRLYAARSPEYRDKLHIFDAWWVFHQLDPMALKLRIPLPPYEAQTSTYVRRVASHYEEMLRKPMPVETVTSYNQQRFDTGLESCSVCGDCDHKIVENGRATVVFCPFTSRRISWCIEIYEGVCENELCQKERRHLCAHCGNPGQLVQTCLNCKGLVS